MEFKFSHRDLTGTQRLLQRFFEILPGALSWAVILGAVILGLVKPLAASVFIIAFDFYLLLRFVYMIIFLSFVRSRLNLEAKTDWLYRAKGLNRIYDYWKELNEQEANPQAKQDLSRAIHRNEMRILEKSKQKAPYLEDLHHLVIIAAETPDAEKLSQTMDSLMRSNFPSIKITAVFAFDYGVKGSLRANTSQLIEKYRDKLFEALVVYASDKLSQETSKRPAIANCAAREAVKYFKARRIPLDKVIVSCFEPGIIISPDYLSCLTYRFMVSPYRQAACFQPIPVYDYTILSSPVARATLNASASFSQLIEAANPDNLVSFSSYSLSLDVLADVDYWPPDSASMDTAIFWKAFIYFNGGFRVIPLYIGYPIKPCAGPYELYRQKREQAMAIENFPMVMRAFLKAERIPFAKKISFTFKLLQTQLLSSVWPFLLFIAGWFPALLSGREFQDVATYYSAPRITFLIFSLMIVGMMMSLILTKLVLPQNRPENKTFAKISDMVTLVPLTLIGIFLQSLAALAVETRLVFRRRNSSYG